MKAFSVYQFRQTLQQTSQGYDCEVVEEPAIQQLLKLDLSRSRQLFGNFQTINQTLKTHVLPAAEQ